MIRWLKRPPLVCLLWLLGFALIVRGGEYFYYEFEGFFPPPLSQSPSWKSITPGETTLLEAMDILGDPEAQYRGNYWTYRYEERTDLGWDVVELWAEDREGERMVIAIWRTLPAQNDLSPAPTVLGELAAVYQKPDRVMGSASSKSRFLIWARHGVGAKIYPYFYEPGYDWAKASVDSILLTEPMGTKRFIRTEWPWSHGPQWYVPDHFYIEISSPSDFPKDPINWEELLQSLGDTNP